MTPVLLLGFWGLPVFKYDPLLHKNLELDTYTQMEQLRDRAVELPRVLVNPRLKMSR
jgi:hypothetical protein